MVIHLCEICKKVFNKKSTYINHIKKKKSLYISHAYNI